MTLLMVFTVAVAAVDFTMWLNGHGKTWLVLGCVQLSLGGYALAAHSLLARLL